MADWRTAVEGAEIAPLDATCGLTEVVKFLGAIWNFVPIFYDADFAQRQGLEGTIVPGPMKLALLTRMLLEWLDGGCEVRAIRCTYRRPDRPGVLRCRGTVLRRYEEAGDTLLDCEIWIENDRGERSVIGAATVGPVHSRH